MLASHQATRTVLIVDDNQLVTRSLMTLLLSEGFNPKTFQAGQPHPVDCWFIAKDTDGTVGVVNNGQVSCENSSSS